MNKRQPTTTAAPVAHSRVDPGMDDWLRKLIPPLLLSGFLWVTSSNEITLEAGLAATLLACFTWWSYQNWTAQPTGSGVPLFAILGAAYWLYFAFPLFWGRPLIEILNILEVGLTTQSITAGMRMAAIGVVMIWFGMHSGIARRMTPSRVLDVPWNARGKRYLRTILGLGILIGFWESAPYVLGGAFRQLMFTLQSVVPLVAFAFILRQVVRRRADPVDRWLVAIFLGVRILVGISSGWLGSLAVLIVIVGIVYAEEKGRVPALAVLLVFVTFLFFQAGKQDFRRTYWYGGSEGGKLARVSFWLERSVENWGNILDDASGVLLRESIYRSFERVSLLPQTANVLELTPEVVPHQGAQLYSYLAVTWIPRFLWPEKPSANESNRFYQVAYGLTAEENLEGVSIAVGVLTESFIAFGWLGVFGIMFLMGVFYEFARLTFMSADSGNLFRAVGAVLVFHFIGIEGQMAQYLGGLVQQIAVVLLCMLPVWRLRSRTGLLSTRKKEWKVRRLQPEY